MILQATAVALTLIFAHAPAEPDASMAQARTLTAEAKLRYTNSDYRESIELFKEALSWAARIEDDQARPAIEAQLRYNLARAHAAAFQVHRDPADLRTAIDLLEKYRRDAKDPKDKREVEQLLAKARRELEEYERNQDLDSASGQGADTKPISAADQRPGRGLELAGYGTIGGGVVLGAVLIGVGASRSSGASDDWLEAETGGQLDDARARGQQGDTMMVVGGVVGGALAVGGAVMVVVRKRKQRSGELSLRPGFTASREHALLSLSGRF